MKKYLCIFLIIFLGFLQIIWVFATENNDKLISVPVFTETVLLYPENHWTIEYNNVQDFYMYFKTVKWEIINFKWSAKVGNINCNINKELWISQSSDIYKYYKISCFWKNFTDGLKQIRVWNTIIWEVNLKFSKYKFIHTFWVDEYYWVWIKLNEAITVTPKIYNGTNLEYETDITKKWELNKDNFDMSFSEYNWLWVWINAEIPILDKIEKPLAKIWVTAKIEAEWNLKIQKEDNYISKYSSLNNIFWDINTMKNFINYLNLHKYIKDNSLYSGNNIYDTWLSWSKFWCNKWLLWWYYINYNWLDNIKFKTIDKCLNYNINPVCKVDKIWFDPDCNSIQKLKFNEWISQKKLISNYQIKLKQLDPKEINSYLELFTFIVNQWYSASKWNLNVKWDASDLWKKTNLDSNTLSTEFAWAWEINLNYKWFWTSISTETSIWKSDTYSKNNYQPNIIEYEVVYPLSNIDTSLSIWDNWVSFWSSSVYSIEFDKLNKKLNISILSEKINKLNWDLLWTLKWSIWNSYWAIIEHSFELSNRTAEEINNKISSKSITSILEELLQKIKQWSNNWIIKYELNKYILISWDNSYDIDSSWIIPTPVSIVWWGKKVKALKVLLNTNNYIESWKMSSEISSTNKTLLNSIENILNTETDKNKLLNLYAIFYIFNFWKYEWKFLQNYEDSDWWKNWIDPNFYNERQYNF